MYIFFIELTFIWHIKYNEQGTCFNNECRNTDKNYTSWNNWTLL